MSMSRSLGAPVVSYNTWPFIQNMKRTSTCIRMNQSIGIIGSISIVGSISVGIVGSIGNVGSIMIVIHIRDRPKIDTHKIFFKKYLNDIQF